jgi:Stress responsive A/B Barrel Domain
MFIHMFSFRWKPGVTAQQKQHVFEEVNALKTRIPGILDSAVGFNTSPRGQGYEFGGVMKFSDRTAYDAYNAHPAHQQLLTWLLPLIDPMEVDFEL